MKIYCCTCKKDIECDLVSGSVIYPHRQDLFHLTFYRCPFCKQYIGCHPNSIRPLGCIPTQEMKKARIIIHSLIDPIWKSGKITRGKLYRLIANELGIKTYHTGWTRSIKQCRDVYRAASKVIKNISLWKGNK